jgi:hypothetical protein
MSVGVEQSAVAMNSELVAAAARLSKAAFVAAHPFYFLSAISLLPAPGNPIETSFEMTVKETKVELPRGGPRMLALRKKMALFTDMITVGRTANNDVPIGHPSISRFHAYFRINSKRVELTDTGSYNGTWVNDARLSPRTGYRLSINDVLRFAELKLRLIDAAHCWEELRMSQ